MKKRTKLLKKSLIIVCSIILVLSNIPSSYAKADVQEWKTVVNDNNVIDSIYAILPNGKLIGRKNEKYFFLNSDLKIISESYDYISDDDYATERLFVGKNGKFGVMDFDENIIIPIRYDVIVRDTPNSYTVRVGENNGIINLEGEVIISIKYETISPILEDLYMITTDGVVGIIDDNEKLIMSATQTYDYWYWYEISSDYIMFVQKGSYYGVLDLKGKVIIPTEYQSINPLPNGMYIVKKNSTYGVMDQTGKMIIPLKYEKIDSTMGDYYKVKIAGKYGLIDQNEKVIVPIEYDEYFYAAPFYGFIKGNKHGIIDQDGKVIIPFEYEQIIRRASEDFYIVTKEGKTGVIDANGNEILPLEYDRLEYSIDQFFAWRDGKQGIIDLKGNVIIPFEYDEIYGGDGDVYTVSKDEKFGMLDQKGNTILELKYDYILEDSFNGLYAVKMDNKYGIVDTHGNTILPLRYDSIYYDNSTELFMVKIGDKEGAVDRNNNVLFDCSYNRLIVLPSDSFYVTNRKIVNNKTTIAFDRSIAEQNIIKIKAGCNLYKKNNISEGKYSSLKVGTKVEWITDINSGWSKVLYGSTIGYVKNSCLNKKELSTYQKTVVTVKVAFRSQQEVKKQTYITAIPVGTKVVVVSDLGKFLQIKYKGKNGYIVKSKTKLK